MLIALLVVAMQGVSLIVLLRLVRQFGHWTDAAKRVHTSNAHLVREITEYGNRSPTGRALPTPPHEDVA